MCKWKKKAKAHVHFIVKSGKLVLDSDFVLWACVIPDEDPIPLIQKLSFDGIGGLFLHFKLQRYIPACLLLIFNL